MEYLCQTHGSQSSDCHCGGPIKSIYWGGPYRRVCCLCGCDILTDTGEGYVELPVTSTSCQMKYIVLKSKDEKIQRVIHKNDAEKLIAHNKAEWIIGSNGVRYVRLFSNEE